MANELSALSDQIAYLQHFIPELKFLVLKSSARFGYEGGTHLGNVLVVFTDKRIPICSSGTVYKYQADLKQAMHYSAFGAPMPDLRWYASSLQYKFGLNGQAQDDEIYGDGNTNSAEYWEYDARLGRRWNIDPVINESESPYAAFRNNPIFYSDYNGDCPDCETRNTFMNKGTIQLPKGTEMKTAADGSVMSFKIGEKEYWYDAAMDWYTTLGTKEVYDPAQYQTYTAMSRFERAAGSYLAEVQKTNPDATLEISDGVATISWGWVSQDMGTRMIDGKPHQVIAEYATNSHSLYESDYPDVGTGESMIPLWGSGKQAFYDFSDGNYGSGILNSVVAVSDAFLVKSIGTGIAKGAWKAGSNTWNATRKWYGSTRNLTSGTQVHHWALSQKTINKYGLQKIGNQPWNLKPIAALRGYSSQTVHLAIHGTSRQLHLNVAQRLWYGTPTWFKAGTISIGGRAVQ